MAAVMKLFNDEFNEGLINPSNRLLFKGATLTNAENARWEKIKIQYRPMRGLPGHEHDEMVKVYAKALVQDPVLFAKVADFKKSTFRCFANGGCDSPLCDQLVFLYEWLKESKPDLLDEGTQDPGTWYLDREKGFTVIKRDGTGRFPAIQPVLKHPKEENSLIDMRKATEAYIIKHLEAMAS